MLTLIQDRYQGSQIGTALAWPDGMSDAVITGLMLDADALDVTKSATVGLQFSFDGGVTFDSPNSIVWGGGTNPLTSGPNYPKLRVSYGLAEARPTHVRGWVDCPAPLSIGLDIDFSAPG